MSESKNKNLVPAAMVFAVAMTFIDQTVVAIAIPDVQRSVWPVGDRLAVGHQRLPRGKLRDTQESSRTIEPEPTEMEA
jgi:hypothetical protein